MESKDYAAVRADAQKQANVDGFDRGVEKNALFGTFRSFMLPAARFRCGFELRCEVVSAMDWDKIRPGHGGKS